MTEHLLFATGEQQESKDFFLPSFSPWFHDYTRVAFGP
jgi:hypothetical protein